MLLKARFCFRNTDMILATCNSMQPIQNCLKQYIYRVFNIIFEILEVDVSKTKKV